MKLLYIIAGGVILFFLVAVMKASEKGAELDRKRAEGSYRAISNVNRETARLEREARSNGEQASLDFQLRQTLAATSGGIYFDNGEMKRINAKDTSEFQNNEERRAVREQISASLAD